MIKKYVDQLKEELENKTKLLELYRELAYHTRPIIIDDKYVELQQQIKELEKEKENDKKRVFRETRVK